MYDVETALPRTENDSKVFLPSQRVNFHRFKQDFYHQTGEKAVGALVMWTGKSIETSCKFDCLKWRIFSNFGLSWFSHNLSSIVIRSFIKGSIEAFQSSEGILPIDSFLAIEILGKKRCRLPRDLRSHVYGIFCKYQVYKNQLGLWDDCDRIRHLLLRLEESKKEDPAAFDQVRKSKIYVDVSGNESLTSFFTLSLLTCTYVISSKQEIQDYTQIECLLFFYLGGPGGLFLAGDPAQSVVEGTEFRFEEIRRWVIGGPWFAFFVWLACRYSCS